MLEEAELAFFVYGVRMDLARADFMATFAVAVCMAYIVSSLFIMASFAIFVWLVRVEATSSNSCLVILASVCKHLRRYPEISQ